MKITKKEIRNGSAWLKRQGGGIIAILKRHQKRITLLERHLRPKGKKYSPPEFCDAPGCNKKTNFQCGENKLGKIGSWCSDKHFKKFAKD